jgi:cyanophycinase
MASAEPVESGAAMVERLKAAGVRDVASLLISRERAGTEEVLNALDRATGIFFTGGDQLRLATNLVGTPVHRKLHEIYRRGAVIGGTSAGAAIMSAVMITGEQRAHPRAENLFTTIQNSNVLTAAGLGFVTNAIVDQHFIARKRQNRLFALVLEHPNLLGVGIDEDTALVVSPLGNFEVIGDGSVMIFDARASPGAKVAENANFSARDVRTHLLVKGEQFDPHKP